MFGIPRQGVAAVAVAFVVVVSGFATLALSGGSGSVARGATPSASTASASAPRSGSGAPAPTAAAERVSALNEALRDRGVPLQDIHPPNLAAERPGARGPVSPTYATGPAPMGLADLGLRNVSGSLEPYALATSSVWGSVNLTRAASVYVDGDGPDTFGIQLNAVASNVTLFGGTGYEFWTQDFVSYTSSTQQLSFGDNVWNFSADAISANVFAATSPNGTLVAPYFYYAVGPTFTVAYPFTLGLYLNSTVVGHEPAVFFNYTVAESNGTTLKGSFDDVVFASSAHPSAHPAPPPAFAINGSAVDPIGLPNDFELDLVGNDDGDTTTFFAMNATLGLAYWNASLGAYATVPSAYDAGSDTGETSTGILPTYTVPVLGGPPTVHVGLGPSYVQGLWNVSAALNGSRSFLLVQRPQNAFLFVSPGTSFDPASAQWVPTLRLGASTTSFVLPNEGNFSLEWMLSDREPETFAVSNLVPLPNSTTGIVLNLTVNATYGSYTPLLAYGNAELKAISQHGAGTLANPYILVHHPLHSLDPVFGQMNDFGFPVFAGVLLVNTTSYVRLLEPAVTIDYGSWQYGQLDGLGLPHVNELQLEFWNVSDVAVLNSSGISGWLSVELSAFPEGELLFWGSSDDLVANDTFYDQGTAIALYGGTGTTIWGNRVLTGATSPWFYEGNNTTGVLEAESGDLVYNNYFADFQPAITPTIDFASCQILCQPASYLDAWNVTPQPASDSVSVLGINLSGSILHTGSQGGNYWANYGNATNPFGSLPYNDSGWITNQGDYDPLYPSAIYTVTFQAFGLAKPLEWNVTILGVTTPASGPTVSVSAPNGSFAYRVVPPGGYLGEVNGTVVVNGTNTTVNVTFVPTFGVSAIEHGLATGWPWSVALTEIGGLGIDRTLSSTTTVALTSLPNGTYSIAASAYGYAAPASLGPIVVAGAFAFLDVNFTVVPLLTITATGLPSDAGWTVTVDQGATIVNESLLGSGTIVFTVLQLAPGPYSWNLVSPGYLGSPATGAGNAPTPSSVTVAFHKVGGSSSPSSAIPALGWAIIGVLAALAAIGFALYVLERRRGPRAPPPIVPASVPAAGATTAAAAPTGPKPWEEGPADAERPDPFVRKS